MIICFQISEWTSLRVEWMCVFPLWLGVCVLLGADRFSSDVLCSFLGRISLWYSLSSSLYIWTMNDVLLVLLMKFESAAAREQKKHTVDDEMFVVRVAVVKCATYNKEENLSFSEGCEKTTTVCCDKQERNGSTAVHQYFLICMPWWEMVAMMIWTVNQRGWRTRREVKSREEEFFIQLLPPCQRV